MPATTVYAGIDGWVGFKAPDSIEGVTDNGATVTIDLTSHNFSAHDVVYITGVVGMTDLNGWHKIDSVNANDITITVDTAQSYTSGGTIQHAVPVVGWTISQTLEIKDYTDSSCVSSSVAWAVCVSSGIKKWSGTFEGIFGDGTTRPAKGTSINYYFYIGGGDCFYGAGTINEEGISLNVLEGDVAKVNYSFIGSGSCVENNS